MATPKSEDKQAPVNAGALRSKSVAQSFWDEQRGEEICYLAERMLRGRDRPRYLYEFTYRLDLSGQDDAMIMVKAIHDGAGEIAFVYSGSLLGGLSNLTGLLRSGKLRWREDDYKSPKLVKLLEELHES